MSDFEARPRESLRDRADDAPGAAGLADGARRRLRRRRTAMAAAGAVAAVVVVVPFLFVDREQQDPAIATDPTSPSATVTATDDGLRTESWHDVTFEVPDTWGFGGASAWCSGVDSPEQAIPTVGRPMDIVPLYPLRPGQGYGLTVGSAAAFDPVYDSGHVWQYDTAGRRPARCIPTAPGCPTGTTGRVITIATPDRALTEQILGTVHRIDGVDDNGCAPTLGEAEAGRSDGTDSTSVCRYDAEDGLEWSWRLSQERRRELGDAVQAAPMRTEVAECGTQSQPHPPHRAADRRHLHRRRHHGCSVRGRQRGLPLRCGARCHRRGACRDRAPAARRLMKVPMRRR